MDENKHATRLALVLALMVVVLVAVSISQFSSGGTEEQQAAVLRAYAQ